ncbi:hypothetical protein GSI_14361 [Ganoderma sinense ZZ0214-1]|uniref:Uncharacterized protein n=1 Tax=Ganoderma sinense ZZ0214-1 TaxID=1077348 RepID=A0A2G8RNG2_9APHY|nr:hypothetical protein GSI_14361 [Ganoderma sinense ZZ0214-1]
MSSRKNGGPATGSPRTNPTPPASASANAAPLTEPTASPLPVVAFSSPTPDVDDAPVASVPDTDPEPAKITASALPESSPSLHPTFAAFLEQAALAERARVLPVETDYTSTASSERSTPCPSTKASSASPLYTHADCDRPECIRAAKCIEDLYPLQREFAKAGMAYHPSMRGVYKAMEGAYRALYACEWKRTAALLREIVGTAPDRRAQASYLFTGSSSAISASTRQSCSTCVDRDGYAELELAADGY